MRLKTEDRTKRCVRVVQSDMPCTVTVPGTEAAGPGAEVLFTFAPPCAAGIVQLPGRAAKCVTVPRPCDVTFSSVSPA